MREFTTDDKTMPGVWRIYPARAVATPEGLAEVVQSFRRVTHCEPAALVRQTPYPHHVLLGPVPAQGVERPQDRELPTETETQAGGGQLGLF